MAKDPIIDWIEHTDWDSKYKSYQKEQLGVVNRKSLEDVSDKADNLSKPLGLIHLRHMTKNELIVTILEREKALYDHTSNGLDKIKEEWKGRFREQVSTIVQLTSLVETQKSELKRQSNVINGMVSANNEWRAKNETLKIFANPSYDSVDEIVKNQLLKLQQENIELIRKIQRRDIMITDLIAEVNKLKNPV